MARVVIFDVDGTLVDTVDLHARAWRETFAHFGHDIPFADVRCQIGKGGDQLMPVFLSEDEIRRRGEEIEVYRGELYKRDHLQKAWPFPQVCELLERLRASGQRVVLASSGKGEEVEHYQEGQKAQARKSHGSVLDAMLGVFTGAASTARRPHAN